MKKVRKLQIILLVFLDLIIKHAPLLQEKNKEMIHTICQESLENNDYLLVETLLQLEHEWKMKESLFNKVKRVFKKFSYTRGNTFKKIT